MLNRRLWTRAIFMYLDSISNSQEVSISGASLLGGGIISKSYLTHPLIIFIAL